MRGRLIGSNKHDEDLGRYGVEGKLCAVFVVHQAADATPDGAVALRLSTLLPDADCSLVIELHGQRKSLSASHDYYTVDCQSCCAGKLMQPQMVLLLSG